MTRHIARLYRLERASRPAAAPPPKIDAVAQAARVLALVTGGLLPDGAPPTALEQRAARILEVMASSRTDDDEDAGADHES